ncbi:MAG TPA: polysaccharide pyruvyl transferase family protein, partial [Candidatus Gracilibacteria bacterium]|nr:polysaccharide pyruvyl transferase family protein [Candidatus Gracilibacteria bacterium]
MPKTISIIGSYGSSNIGDEAILEVALRNMATADKKYIWSGNPAKTRAHIESYQNPIENYEVVPHLPFGFRSLFTKNWFSTLKALFNSELFYLGGGGLLTDEKGMKAVLLWFFQVLPIIILKKPLYIWANSFGPIHSNLAKKLVRYILRNTQVANFRDQISSDLALKISPQTPVLTTTDSVFAYPLNIKIEKEADTIALSFRPWSDHLEIYQEFLSKLAADQQNICLIAMEESDVSVLHQISQGNYPVLVPQNYQELLEILSKTEKAIGMRLHFLIAASLAECKTGGIAYSSKVKGVFQDLELPYQ